MGEEGEAQGGEDRGEGEGSGLEASGAYGSESE